MARTRALIIFFLLISPLALASAHQFNQCPPFECVQFSYKVGFFIKDRFTSQGNNDIETGTQVLHQENVALDFSKVTRENIDGNKMLTDVKVKQPKAFETCFGICSKYNKDASSAGGSLANYWTLVLMANSAAGGSYGPLFGKCFCYSKDVCIDNGKPTWDDRPQPLLKPSVFSFAVTGIICITIIRGEPHFAGADGSHFDFSGIPNHNYALVSDKDLQVNAFFGGRYDKAEAGAVPKALTWMRKVGVVWKSHTIVLEAREGPSSAYGNGYMQRMLVDGHAVTLANVGETAEFEFANEGSVSISWVLADEPSADDSVDKYQVKVGDVLDLVLTLRPEVEMLRTPEDGTVHFTLEIVNAQFSNDVHGVIGQTYRPDFVNRLKGQKLVWSSLLQTMAVPGDNAEGFIDGNHMDYMVTDLLSTDSRISRFTAASVGSARKMLKRSD